MTDHLVELIAEFRNLRNEVRQAREDLRTVVDVIVPRADPDADHFATTLHLLEAIWNHSQTHSKNWTFSSGHLIRHTDQDPFAIELRRAICAIVKTDKRRAQELGNRLRGSVGKRYGQFMVLRYGADSVGAIWEVKRLDSPLWDDGD